MPLHGLAGLGYCHYTQCQMTGLQFISLSRLLIVFSSSCVHKCLWEFHVFINAILPCNFLCFRHHVSCLNAAWSMENRTFMDGYGWKAELCYASPGENGKKKFLQNETFLPTRSLLFRWFSVMSSLNILPCWLQLWLFASFSNFLPGIQPTLKLMQLAYVQQLKQMGRRLLGQGWS